MLSLNNRKVFRGLLGLSKKKDEGQEKSIKLSEAVAVDCYQIEGIILCIHACDITHETFYVGQTYPKKSQDITQRDELSKSISKWSSDARGSSTILNPWQEEAMEIALSEPFQLIQGPPGKI